MRRSCAEATLKYMSLSLSSLHCVKKGDDIAVSRALQRIAKNH